MIYLLKAPMNLVIVLGHFWSCDRYFRIACSIEILSWTLYSIPSTMIADFEDNSIFAVLTIHFLFVPVWIDRNIEPLIGSDEIWKICLFMILIRRSFVIMLLTTLYLEDHYCVFLLGTVNRINAKYTNSIILK